MIRTAANRPEKAQSSHSVLKKILFIVFICLAKFSHAVNIDANYYASNSCGSNVTLYDNGGSGSNYADNCDGYYVLRGGGTMVINISGSYTTEATYDKIYIYNGEGTWGTLLASYSGSGSINYTGTAGQTLTVRFTSDGSTNKSGFALNITYTGTCPAVTQVPASNLNNNSIACGATNMVLQDNGGSTGFYQNNSDGYTVLQASGTAVINISGTYSTEGSHDYIRIYSGTGTGGTLLTTYSGAGTINYTSTAGTTLTVRFTSDNLTGAVGFYFNIVYSSACVVCTAPSALTYTANTATYCASSSVTNTPSFTGTATSVSYAVTPTLPAGLTMNTGTGVITGIPTATTAAANYVVTVTNSCGSTTAPVTLTISLPVANAGSDVSIGCGGSTVLNGSGNNNVTALFSTSFESGLGSWTTQNSTAGGTPANANWTVTSGLWAGSINSGSKYIMSNSGFTSSGFGVTGAGPGNSGDNILKSPAFSTVGYSIATLSYRQFFSALSDFKATVYTEISTNGTSWTNLFNTTATQGTGTSFSTKTIDISAYANQATVYVRFRYNVTSPYNSNFWALDDIIVTGGNPPTYAWSPSTGLSATNIFNPTANPSVTTDYTLTTTANGCSASDVVQVAVTNPTSAPTAITTPSTICYGNTVTLTTSGGTSGSSSVDLWYKGSCSNAFEQNWVSQPYALGSATLNSNSNGILKLTSTTNDPVIQMTSLGSFDPAVYKYIQIRYRVIAGTAGSAEMFFLNTTNTGAAQTHAVSGALISDGNWQVLNIDMSANANWLTGGNITGFRYDWTSGDAVTMELDFISLSAGTIVGTGSSLTVSPTSTTTYYANRRDNCGATTCVSTTVTLPTANAVLSGNESATCIVKGTNWIHFYSPAGKLIVSINPNGNDLGSVTATSYVPGNPVLTQACGTGSNPVYTTAAMGRSWSIVPTNNLAASIRLPFGDAELSSLQTAALNTVSNPFDNIGSVGALKLSKYSGVNQNNSWSDNCTQNGGSGGTIVINQTSNGALTAANGFVSTIPASTYTQFNIPGFSEFWLHGTSNASPLPVTLSSLTASCNEKDEVILSWSTGSEQNSMKFIAEKSRDLDHWSSFREVAASGNSNYEIDYAVEDLNASGGVSYYRLVQVDNNGQEQIYGPISVSCANQQNKMTIFPNPAKNKFTVEISSLETVGNASIQITDLAGKIISSRSIQLLEGVNQILFEDENLESGTYIVCLMAGDGLFNHARIVLD